MGITDCVIASRGIEITNILFLHNLYLDLRLRLNIYDLRIKVHRLSKSPFVLLKCSAVLKIDSCWHDIDNWSKRNFKERGHENFCMRSSVNNLKFITARVRSTREGNIYTWKCLSVHFWGGGSQVQVGGSQVSDFWGGRGPRSQMFGGGIPGLRFLGGGYPVSDFQGGVPGLSKGKIF